MYFYSAGQKQRLGKVFFFLREKEMIIKLILTCSSLSLRLIEFSHVLFPPTFLSQQVSGKLECIQYRALKLLWVFLPYTISVSLNSASPDISSLTLPSLYFLKSGLKFHKIT